MQQVPDEIAQLAKWIGQLKEGPLRLFLNLDGVVANLHAIAQQCVMLTEQKTKLVETVEELKRTKAEWDEAVDRAKARMTEEQEHGRANLQAFRDERATIQREADARLAQTQDAYAAAQGELETVRRAIADARHDLATIKDDVAQRLKHLQAVTE